MCIRDRIATDPSNPATAYVTFSGFTSTRIYKTNDYGANWTNVSGNLPGIPTNCVVVNPTNGNNIFVGTDLGVFSTTNGGSSWVPVSYTHLRAHETVLDLVCRLLLEKKHIYFIHISCH